MNIFVFKIKSSIQRSFDKKKQSFARKTRKLKNSFTVCWRKCHTYPHFHGFLSFLGCLPQIGDDDSRIVGIDFFCCWYLSKVLWRETKEYACKSSWNMFDFVLFSIIDQFSTFVYHLQEHKYLQIKLSNVRNIKRWYLSVKQLPAVTEKEFLWNFSLLFSALLSFKFLRPNKGLLIICKQCYIRYVWINSK